MISWSTDPSSACWSISWWAVMTLCQIWRSFGTWSRNITRTLMCLAGTSTWTSCRCSSDSHLRIRSCVGKLLRSSTWLGLCWSCGKSSTGLNFASTETSCYIWSWTCRSKISWEIIEMTPACLLRPLRPLSMLWPRCCSCSQELLTISLKRSFSTSRKRHISCSISQCCQSSSIHDSCGASWERTCRSVCLGWRRRVWKDRGLVRRSSKCSPDIGWPCTFAFKSISEPVVSQLWKNKRTWLLTGLFAQVRTSQIMFPKDTPQKPGKYLWKSKFNNLLCSSSGVNIFFMWYDDRPPIHQIQHRNVVYSYKHICIWRFPNRF